jgi:hypothetical protein
MSIQNVYGSQGTGGRLRLVWEALGFPIATSVQVAFDTEFTVETRTFVLPKGATQCELDVGGGNWFYRVGAWIGDDKDGIVEWSGIYGPITLQTNKALPHIEAFPLVLTDVRPAYNAIVFHTGIYEKYYMIVHVTQKDTFKASGMKTYYKFDWGAASIQISGLDPNATHSFQLQMFIGDKSSLPTTSVKMLTGQYEVRNKKTAMVVKPATNTDHATYAADKAILQDSIGRRKQNFGSYAQYLQFQAAKARTTARQ